MKPNELRIGNYVKPMIGELEHVMCVDFIGCEIGGELIDENYEEYLSSYQESKPEYIEPILLTEEWLLKFGFDMVGYMELKHGQQLQFDLIKNEIAMYGSDSVTSGQCFFAPCKYVHQLQNLYFALTGEELTA